MASPKKAFWSLRKALHSSKKGKPTSPTVELSRRASYSPVPLSQYVDDAPNDELNEKYGEFPAVVLDTLQYLESRESYKVEGLFRVPGSVADIQEVCKEYEDGGSINMSKITTPHTVSGILKSYLRSHTSDLLTKKLYKLFLSVGSVQHEPTRVLCISLAFALLPKYNQAIVRRLMEFLQKMVQHMDLNKMPIANLALIFAPALLPPQEESLESAIFKGAEAAMVITTMLKNYKDIFTTTPDILVWKIPADARASVQLHRFESLYTSVSQKECQFVCEDEPAPANDTKAAEYSEYEEYELPIILDKEEVDRGEKVTPLERPQVVRTQSAADIRLERFKSYRKARPSTNVAMNLYMHTLRKDPVKRISKPEGNSPSGNGQAASPSTDRSTEAYEQEIKNVLVWYLMDGNEEMFEKRVFELANDERDREYIKSRTMRAVSDYDGGPRPAGLVFSPPATPKSQPKQELSE